MTSTDSPGAGLVERGIEIMQEWIERQPAYQGDDAKANHYKRNREALEACIATLSPPSPAREAVNTRQITSISVQQMYESCERHSFYVQLKTDEGFTMTAGCHQTGSIYTDGKGLTIEEARERALSDAADWGDLLQITPDDFKDDKGEVIEPNFKLERYTTRRKLAERDQKNVGDCKSCDGRGWFSNDMMGTSFSDCEKCNGTGGKVS